MTFFLNFLREYKYRVYILLFVLIFIFFFTISSILVPLIIGALIAYLFYTPFLKLHRIIKSQGFSAFLISLFTFFLLIFPFSYLIMELTNELLNIYSSFNQSDYWLSLKENIIKTIYYFIPYENVREQLITLFFQTQNFLIKLLYNFIGGVLTLLPTLLLNIVVILSAEFYFLLYGKKIVKFLETNLPFGPYNYKLLENIRKTVDSLIFGLIFPALAQSLAFIFILFVLGIKINYLFYGFISFILSLLPVIGIWILAIPVAIKLWSVSIWKTIILIIYYVIVIMNIDNVVRIIITSKKGKIPIWLILFTVSGGLLTHGFVGMIVALFLGCFIYYTYESVLEENKKYGLLKNIKKSFNKKRGEK